MRHLLFVLLIGTAFTLANEMFMRQSHIRSDTIWVGDTDSSAVWMATEGLFIGIQRVLGSIFLTIHVRIRF